MTLWGHMEDMIPQKWRSSMSLRRSGFRGILQCDSVTTSTAQSTNPGDQINPDWNFDPEQRDGCQIEYPDAPPPDCDTRHSAVALAFPHRDAAADFFAISDRFFLLSARPLPCRHLTRQVATKRRQRGFREACRFHFGIGHNSIKYDTAECLRLWFLERLCMMMKRRYIGPKVRPITSKGFVMEIINDKPDKQLTASAASITLLLAGHGCRPLRVVPQPDLPFADSIVAGRFEFRSRLEGSRPGSKRQVRRPGRISGHRPSDHQIARRGIWYAFLFPCEWPIKSMLRSFFRPIGICYSEWNCIPVEAAVLLGLRGGLKAVSRC